ncbi:MAG: 3' terminal RNA ribose 2'-O-methyltransferase Hen1 [Bacteroidota bacterium]
MLLTITYTGRPATDLGYLLHKNPSRPQSFDLSFGKAHVFYPEASAERCTAALLLEINPIDLAREHRDSAAEPLFAYVNDRPYVASSFMSVALAQVFGTAMAGRSKERPELAQQALPLEAMIAALPARGGDEILRRFFSPLGYQLDIEGYSLDKTFPSWGQSQYYTLSLKGTLRLADLLNHLYVLIPALDVKKHYWIGEDEIDKLLRHGEGWLAAHPERELITSRYLKRRRNLVHEALQRLLAEDDPAAGEEKPAEDDRCELEGGDKERLNLNEQRLGTVVAVLKNLGVRRLIDLGCGEGRLLERLLKEKSFQAITGMDVSHRALEAAHSRLRLDSLPPQQRERVNLFQGALTYQDKRWRGYDAATLMEVIEHLELNQLPAMARALFGFARPPVVVITTPNKEYNVRYDGMKTELRHGDHRFEWTRREFRDWAASIAEGYGYTVRHMAVGDEDPNLGAPTQMGVFTASGGSTL